MQPELLFVPEEDMVLATGLSPEALAEAAENYRVLPYPLADGQIVYPSFQLGLSGVRPEVEEFLALFAPTGFNGHEITTWLWTPASELFDTAPITIFLSEGLSPVLRSFMQATHAPFTRE
jgi:hypothetical protein